MEFNVYSIKSNEWEETVKKSNLYDFHHTSVFHEMETNDNEKAVLLKGSYDNIFIALPLIIKEIPGSEYFDATSVYGYCGPIYSDEFEGLPNELLSFFKIQALNYFKAQGIISVFSRLHPLINQTPFFTGFGKTIDINKTVSIDLRQDLDIQRQDYSRAYKNQINKLRKKKGYSARLLNIEEIDEFIKLYYETMDRVEADPYYYFTKEYFLQFVTNDSFQTKIIIAENEIGEIVSGSMFTITNKIMQYHLGGTKNDYLIDTPIKIVMDEARLLGVKYGLDYLHLGGGVGGSDDDSLFRFKSGFSKNFHQFSVWNLVVNQVAYDKLVQDKGVKEEEYPNFFPLYRAV